MDIDFTTFDGKLYCSAMADRGRYNGVLHFGHEISVTFVKDGDGWKFDGAWHVGVYEAAWNADEEDTSSSPSLDCSAK